MDSKISSAELAEAFAGDKNTAKKVAKKATKNATESVTKNVKPLTKKKKVLSICLLVTGAIALVAGVVFLVLNILKMNQAADGDYLVAAENWTLEGEDGVVWNFTEIGKGSLTTNGHLNDYDFIWALEDGRLLIETDWLYDLENKYEYQLDQSTGVLTLTDGDGATYKFIAQ